VTASRHQSGFETSNRPPIRDGPTEASRFWWLVLIVALASTAAGVVVVARPSESLNTFALIVGIFFLVSGIVGLIASLVVDTNKALGAILSVLEIVVGLVLVRHPANGASAIGLLLGIFLVGAGCVRLFNAMVVAAHPLRQGLIAAAEVCAGVVIVAQPHIGGKTLAIVVGVWLIANGIGMIALSMAIRTAHVDAPVVDDGDSRGSEPVSRHALRDPPTPSVPR
jgi:uncharacterized membrane protein HdeD (DUF308 family)